MTSAASIAHTHWPGGGRGPGARWAAHYHVLALDGVVSGDAERGVRFHEATRLDVRDAEALACTVQLRILRWFARRGLLDSTTAANMRTWRGTGGSSVDGSVRIEGEDRAGLKRLLRYCARGPLAPERLHAPSGIGTLSSPEARLVYRLPEPDVHGRRELRLTPLGLLERLARLVPPPRIHRHRYHGVLAPNARLRSTVVTIGRPVPHDSPVGVESPSSPDHAPRTCAAEEPCRDRPTLGHTRWPRGPGSGARSPRVRRMHDRAGGLPRGCGWISVGRVPVFQAPRPVSGAPRSLRRFS